MFAVAVVLALLKLGSFSGAKPFFLKMVPATPVAKAAQPVAGDGEILGDEALDLPDADVPGTVGRLLTIGSRASNLPGRQDSARTRKPARNEAPVFYRPSSGKGTDGGPVCGNLGDFPKSSRVVFPLPEDYFDSYEDTWGAARPQGGHEGADLMSPTGTPEFAITDGTVVPVKGANENGWNRLGGYTVMLEAAYDAGPIEEGDLFYYAHMEEESALKVGTKVRAGQQLGVVGDTGEGREATRGRFPPHLHFGWYGTGSADSRTDLESGAMNPYPLLLWLEEYGGSITGGMDASYCEAPREEPAPNFSGATPDLDTGDRNDARPSPVAEQNRDGQNPPEPERENRTEEKSERTDEKNQETGATDDATKASPAGSSAKEDGAGDERGERSTPGAASPAPDGDRTSGPSTDAVTETDASQAETWAKIRTLLKDPSPPDPASRRSYVSALMEVLRKAEKKNEHDGRNAGAPDKKKQADEEKQKNPKQSPEPPERKEPRKARSVREATSQNPRPVVKEAPAPKTDREESPDATEPKGRKLSESGSQR
ncbi:MAG: peptidoglycan DD-metalloendopeptidase family protein [Actinobacteria bacterium]|nr:peptidoglycan DD-metalloendopeptidase family protein [Actinomycetota bacterium]